MTIGMGGLEQTHVPSPTKTEGDSNTFEMTLLETQNKIRARIAQKYELKDSLFANTETSTA